MFGFKQGRLGNFVLIYGEGAELRIDSNERQPSVFTRIDGTALVTASRGDTSSAVGSDGRTTLASRLILARRGRWTRSGCRWPTAEVPAWAGST
jgi:hypothetical protein